MKSVAFAIVFSGLLCAQAPQVVQVSPGTPQVKPPVQPGVPATLPAPVAPDSVVLEANGKKYTAAEVDKLISMLPAQYQQMARSQPQALTQLFIFQKLSEDAEKAGLDKESPYKEQLEWGKMQVLTQAELTIHGNTLEVPDADQQKYYKDHPEKFHEAKVKVIYLAFNPNPNKPPAADVKTDGKKVLTEAEASAKINALRKQIQEGADFGKLARENSDDASAAKDGDFGVMKPSSPYPDPIKKAVFALKAGEISEPIRQPNGFYLVRVDEMNTQTFDEAHVQVLQDLRQERFGEWTKALQEQYTVKVDNPAYFTPKAPAQLQPVR